MKLNYKFLLTSEDWFSLGKNNRKKAIQEFRAGGTQKGMIESIPPTPDGSSL